VGTAVVKEIQAKFREEFRGQAKNFRGQADSAS
jgi:hypothetical protein